jgi:DNA-binding beta-propeller fold protein YncE
MVLKLIKTLNLPAHLSGGFDHGDIFEKSGYSFVAHTGNGTIEMYNGWEETHLKTISGVPEASGVLCAQNEQLTFAASRGTGKIFVLDGMTGATICVVQAGSKPNGIAWDSKRHRLLVADVGDFHIRIVDPSDGRLISDTPLSGRPRWCKYSSGHDKFIVNVHDPSEVAIIDPETARIESLIPVSEKGAHGLDIDEENGFAYVACDGGAVVSVDLNRRREIKTVKILSNPDVACLNLKHGLLYCANSKPGLVQVIDVNKMRLKEEVTTEEGCHTVAFHQKSQKLHAYLPKSCRVAFYSEQL